LKQKQTDRSLGYSANARLLIASATLLITILACSSLVPVPTATTVPTMTLIPTWTLTATLEPTSTATTTSIPPTESDFPQALPLPSEEAASEWNGIPIMPGALAGEGDNLGYTFTIDAPLEDIQRFYEKELAELGWNMFVSGNGTTGTALLFFMKDADTLSVSVIPQADGIMYVLLVM